MPKFVLDTGTADRQFNELDPFTQGYIEALFFTEEAPGTDENSWDPEIEGSFPGTCTFADLDPESLKTIITECADFQRDNVALLGQAYEAGMRGGASYDEMQAGRDFWFTRNRHGVGYWDRGLPKPVADGLTAAAHSVGETWASYDPDSKLIYIG